MIKREVNKKVILPRFTGGGVTPDQEKRKVEGEGEELGFQGLFQYLNLLSSV